MELTPAQSRFMDRLRYDGDVWFVPAQSNMVRRLMGTGEIKVTDETMFDVLDNISKRRAVWIRPEPVSP